MAIRPQLSLGHMLAHARNKLGMTQREFGPALGASHRTAQRWDAGKTTLSPLELRKLTELLVPLDRALATEAAAHLGETLESLGLVAPGPPPESLAPPTPPPTPPEDLVDIVVCAAAEASDVSPRAMRSLLYVAFRRAHQVGLTVEQVERALAPAPTKKTR